MTLKYSFNSDKSKMDIIDHKGNTVNTVENTQAPQVDKNRDRVPINPDFIDGIRPKLESEFTNNGMNKYIFNVMVDIASNNIEEK